VALVVKPGDRFFVLAARRQEAMDAKRTYREMKIKRVYSATFLAESLTGSLHWFWKNSRHEIDNQSQWATLEPPRPDIFEIDERFRGRSWDG
jgi:hypothetical protein